MRNRKLTNEELHSIAIRMKAVADAKRLHRGQRRVVDAIFNKGCKRVLMIAGRSWRKSHTGMYLISRLLCIPNQSAYMIGPTRKQEKELAWEPSDGIKSYIPSAFNPRCTETEQRIELPWNSFAKIDGSENHQAYRGVPYDFMFLDEAQMADWRFYEASYANLSKRNGILVVAGTMDQDINNPFMKLWQEALTDPDWLVINAPSWENEEIRPWLEKEKKKYYARGDEAEWEREYECRYVTGGKRAVYPMFSPVRHCKPASWLQARTDESKRKLEYWTIFDPGSKSVFAVIFCALNRDTSEVFVLDEIYETDPLKTTPRQIWERAVKLEKQYYGSKPEKVFRVYDEAASWFAVAISVEFGVGLIPTTKASRDKWDDIGIIKDAMLADKVHIADHCENFIKEHGSWQTDEHGEPIKKHDHTIDDFRYFFRMSGYTLNPQTVLESNGYSRHLGESIESLESPPAPQADLTHYDDELLDLIWN